VLYVRWWDDWRALRMFPFEGDMGDQPAYFVDVIRVAEAAFEAATARRRAEAEESMRRKLDAEGRKRGP